MAAAEALSAVMRSLGIVQEHDPLLHEVASPFDLPDEAQHAERVVGRLRSVAERVSRAHAFTAGMGIAAPQIGVSTAAAVVRSPDRDWITLLNPVVIGESSQGDEQYEGCLSFFDVRGVVPRPLRLHVEHQALDGQRQETVFEGRLARLVAHEVDHLNGLLYTGRMRPNVTPIPVSEYRQLGRTRQHGTST